MGAHKQRYILHIDMNSFFATCEQQANRLLRGKPVGVAAYPSPKSILLAASIEAKQCGIGTGTSVCEAQSKAPDLVVLENDPPLYRALSTKIEQVIRNYSDCVEPYSIDEHFVDLTGWVHSWEEARTRAKEIQQRIKQDVGEWMHASVGISSTKFLAKVGSDYKKPNGLTVITPQDIPDIYDTLHLTDLWGVARGWEQRLKRIGITTIRQLYEYPLQNMVSLFGKPGHVLYANIHGQETSYVHAETSVPKSISHQYAIPRALVTTHNIPAILMKLCEKVGARLRAHELCARRVWIYLRWYNKKGTHLYISLPYAVRSTLTIYHHAVSLLHTCQTLTHLRLLAIGVSHFESMHTQLSLFEQSSNHSRDLPLTKKSDKKDIDDLIDTINHTYGAGTMTHATMLGSAHMVPDRIAFGK